MPVFQGNLPDNKEELEKIKYQEEIEKLRLEKKDIKRNKRRFFWGSIFTPLIVATVTILIFWFSGFFNAQNALLEAKIVKNQILGDSIKNKTSEYTELQKSKIQLMNMIELLKKDSTKLNDSIQVFKDAKKAVYNNLNEKQKQIANLILDTLNLRRKLAIANGFIKSLQQSKSLNTDNEYWCQKLRTHIKEYGAIFVELYGRTDSAYLAKRIQDLYSDWMMNFHDLP